ncbi:MAG: glycerate kinase [Variovorax sp.]|nr:MAG: glycerate kinase [Variovorax sp.]
MSAMNFQKLMVPLGGLILLAVGYNNYGWPGVAVVSGGIVMFLLLHFTRTMQVLQRAADRPVGHVASAVMLNAKLKPKMTLLHVVAMTRSLGELRSVKDAQPEVYRWTDAGESWVEGEFVDGKLRSWQLTRPEVAADPVMLAAPAMQSTPADEGPR